MKSVTRGLRVRRWADDEQGFTLVFLSLMLVLLLALAGFVVDITNWGLQGSKIQRTADAASLAGAVFMPDDFSTATSVAMDTAAKNGYTTGNSTIRVDKVSGHPDQLKVTITQTVRNYFAQVIGMPTNDITKTATAEFQKPIAMGSPTNQFGNDPESSGSPGSDTYPNFWANVVGGGTAKSNGDAYQGGNPGACDADNCTGGNQDYDSDGYYYTVHFNQTATVNLQIFDPGYVKVGLNCDWAGANLNAADNLSVGSVRGWPTGASPGPSVRYRPVNDASNPADPGYRYCTGDDDYGSDSPPTTTYQVFGPATLPGVPSSADPAPGACGTQWSFPPYQGDLTTGSKSLTSNTKVAVLPTNQNLGSYFRQWWTLCSGLSGTAGQDYFVQVKTNTGNGRNGFAIRAQNSGSGAVSVYGSAKMSIYANVAGSSGRFYLARLLPGAAKRTLVLNFFDIGDGNSATGTLTIQPPTDSNVGSAFSGCTYKKMTDTSPTNAPGCAILNVTTTTFNKHWVQVRVPIPSGYTCDDTTPTGCWTKIVYQFNNTLHDVTSWNASLEGDPVRIVK